VKIWKTVLNICNLIEEENRSPEHQDDLMRVYLTHLVPLMRHGKSVLYTTESPDPFSDCPAMKSTVQETTTETGKSSNSALATGHREKDIIMTRVTLWGTKIWICSGWDALAFVVNVGMAPVEKVCRETTPNIDFSAMLLMVLCKWHMILKRTESQYHGCLSSAYLDERPTTNFVPRQNENSTMTEVIIPNRTL
jgi:hypothetical protein